MRLSVEKEATNDVQVQGHLSWSLLGNEIERTEKSIRAIPIVVVAVRSERTKNKNKCSGCGS